MEEVQLYPNEEVLKRAKDAVMKALSNVGISHGEILIKSVHKTGEERNSEGGMEDKLKIICSIDDMELSVKSKRPGDPLGGSVG